MGIITGMGFGLGLGFGIGIGIGMEKREEKRRHCNCWRRQEGGSAIRTRGSGAECARGEERRGQEKEEEEASSRGSSRSATRRGEKRRRALELCKWCVQMIGGRKPKAIILIAIGIEIGSVTARQELLVFLAS